MSYIYDSKGEIINNPINETNTRYSKFENYTVEGDTEGALGFGEDENTAPYVEDQYMYNNEPISQIDTEYNNDIRQRLEQLRTRTESMNMALESALVPSIIYGNIKQEKDCYIFNDSETLIQTIPTLKDTIIQGEVIKQYVDNINIVFRCNMVKLLTSKKDRLCYNGTIHLYTKKGDTKVSFIHRVNKESDDVISVTPAILNAFNPHLKDIPIDEELDEGIEIDTGCPSTLYNMYKLNLVNAFLIFINGYAIGWKDTTICTDNKDTFLIINIKELTETYKEFNDNSYNLEMTYLDIPFKVLYSSDTIINKDFNRIPVFSFYRNNGIILSNDEYKQHKYEVNDREHIYCDDPYIIYEEFEMDENSLSKNTTSNIGVLYNKQFTDMDYRYKIKKINMLCFENGKIVDDFTVESHQFNILKININSILKDSRRFKIFYNTKVLYDQDNVLRIKNRQFIMEEFNKYMCEVTSNVQTFIDEIYRLYKEDKRLEYGKDYDISPDNVEWGTVTKNLQIGLVSKKLNNMEEGSTPADEFIYYCNIKTMDLFKELAKQIFKNDQPTVKNTIDKLIEQAYLPNFVQYDNDKKSPMTILESGEYIVNEWFIRKNLAEMFKYDIENDYAIEDMSLLDEVFDFSYSDKVSYKENLSKGLSYVMSYDADKLESGIKRGVVSITRKGSELVNLVYDNRLTMSRWKMNKNDNFVIIFHNGLLYYSYNTIKYDDLTFSVYMPETLLNDNNIFEFVFFLNCNNTISEYTYKGNKIPIKKLRDSNGDYIKGTTESDYLNSIPLNTTMYDPEEVMLFYYKIPYDKAELDEDSLVKNGAYLLDHDTYSYKSILSSTNDIVEETLSIDNKINGIHRVTKQGGGEYFIKPCFYGQNDKLFDKRAFANSGVTHATHFTFNSDKVFTTDYPKSNTGDVNWLGINVDKKWRYNLVDKSAVHDNDPDRVIFLEEGGLD